MVHVGNGPAGIGGQNRGRVLARKGGQPDNFIHHFFQIGGQAFELPLKIPGQTGLVITFADFPGVADNCLDGGGDAFGNGIDKGRGQRQGQGAGNKGQQLPFAVTGDPFADENVQLFKPRLDETQAARPGLVAGGEGSGPSNIPVAALLLEGDKAGSLLTIIL